MKKLIVIMLVVLGISASADIFKNIDLDKAFHEAKLATERRYYTEEKIEFYYSTHAQVDKMKTEMTKGWKVKEIIYVGGQSFLVWFIR